MGLVAQAHSCYKSSRLFEAHQLSTLQHSIVLVHGLTGDREKTWTANNDDSPWPQSLLPSKIPNARVLTFGYDAYVADWRGMVSQNRIGNHSMNLLTSIATFREDDDTNDRPIIFICHSLGGLVCEDALSAAARRPERHLRAIIDCTCGILFLGTPHHGSGLAKWAGMLAVMIGILKQTNPQILAVFEKESEVLARVQDEFHTMVRSRNQERLQPIEITCFFEEIPLPGVGVVVPKDSAILPGYIPIGIHSNHMDMTKFEREDEPGFIAITGELRRWIKELTVPSRQQHGLQDSTSSRPTPSLRIPFRRDQDFVDCDILPEISQKCSLAASRVALVGLGGVGKSQLAIEYSYRIREESPETWVFWVHAGTRARFEEGYKAIAEIARVDGLDKPSVDILQLVSNWLCDEVNGQWVMIVDNADDPNVLFKQATDYGSATVARSLSDFLPQSPNGSIVLTSRSRDVAFKFTGRNSDIVTVGPMNEAHALALLHKKLEGHLDMTDAAELVQTLEYMPLAITQAAAYISQRAPRINISKYLHDFRGSDKNRASLLQKDAGDIRRDSTASNSIIATWQISFEYIRKERLSAARLLSLMSLFDRQGIPEALLLQNYQDNGDVKANFEDDLSTLTNYSLVTMNVEGDEFEMHRLVQFSTKKWLELHEELENWKEKYIDIMGNAFPIGRYENRRVCGKLFPHAQMVLLFCPTNEVYLAQWASILFNAAWYSSEIGSYNTAEEMDRRALEGREKVLGKEHPNTLTSVSNLASVLQNQGKYEQAEEMNRRALEGHEKVLGKEHPDTLTSVSILASVLQYQGKYEQAEEMNRRALEGYEKVLGKEHPNTLTSVSNLALVLQYQGKYEQAEEMNRRALEGYEKVLGKEHPNTLTSVSNLALVLQHQGKYEQAEEMNRRALEGYEKVLGKEHPSTLTSVYCLAYLFHQRDEFENASILYQRAYIGYQKVLGPDHPTTKACSKHYVSLLEHSRG
ncbi:uncharacterized protein LY89DRAFT_365096 [Mollisia scopiformis]|uniref:Uncharacterized protein n=1 Tax=Mollisia scopiformis TaxID=149040 RepID=A0A132B4P8_MOLSC|nr:uncharacterized protein LY89DRAFT_365096 [Mollisia scopiformis]KUJ07385.1 hypothetical protein LY89DRAFT_365096 [Mollisia scopiformis]